MGVQVPARPPATESEKRLRFFVELRVRFILLDGSLTGPAFVSSISSTDLFVETDRPLPIGTRARMRLYVPGQDAVDIRAVVLRHGEGQRMLGMRMEFTDLGERGADAIAAHLAPRRKAFVESTDGMERTTAVLGETSYIFARPSRRSRRKTDPAIPLPPTAPDVLHPASPDPVPPPTEPGDDSLSTRFDPDALKLFVSMHGKVLQFLDTLDTATLRTILDSDETRPLAPLEPQPGKVPAPFEEVRPSLFDPELVDEDELPLVSGMLAEPTESTDEEERLRLKYGVRDDLLDAEEIRGKYGIDEDLFGDDDGGTAEEPAPAAEPVPRTPAASGAFRGAPAPPSVGSVVNRLGESREQRRACALELRKRGEEALARGLVLKAASDLQLALAFDGSDPELRALADRVREQANGIRAEDLYRQGLQQAALGDLASAAKLLAASCGLAPARKHVIATAKVLLQSGTPDALRDCHELLRAALDREPDSVEFNLLYARTAEEEKVPKMALRYYQRVLELDPDNEQAKECIARVGGS